MMAECLERCRIGRHCMIGKVAPKNLTQPFPLLGDGLMHAPPQRLLDLVELRSHSVTPRFPLNLELALARASADECEAQEVEGLRFAEPFASTPVRYEAAELDQTRFVRMKRQR
jgi:hypothetical protein